MNKKAILVAILLLSFAAAKALVAEERVPKRLPEQFISKTVRPERSAAVSPAYRPVSGTPTEILAAEVERGKDYCILGGGSDHSIADWFQGPEWYANYQDPVEYGCTDVWPFQVTEIRFTILTEGAMSISVQGFVFEDVGRCCAV